MLTTTQMPEKLYKAAEEFKKDMEQGNYCKARYTYYRAVIAAKFIELDMEVVEKLFGEGGAFPPELVKKAWEEKTC